MQPSESISRDTLQNSSATLTLVEEVAVNLFIMIRLNTVRLAF